MNSDVNDMDVQAEGTDPGEPTPSEAGADELIKAREENEQLQDRLLRTTAEFDNYRKRVDRERKDMADRAAEGVLADLLPIIDDLDRALAAAEAGESGEGYRRGVELIHKQLLDLLTRRGVTPVETVGQMFDPHLHQSVSSEPSPAHRDGEIIEELRRGYRLGERLLRPAMVKVAQA
jgi:molecular chaperone GrpE